MDIFSGLNCSQIYVINLIKKVCKLKDVKSYIVGGAVRDALLKVKVRDIDICVDKDPKIIIESLAEIKTFKYYSEFQTAALEFKNGVSVDIIRCRKESYTKYGMLPKITPSDIDHDLFRRDFTINALAYDLGYNKLIDLYGGILDIKNKSIRKIHNNSYEEDCTRIFRAIKYSIRYKFSLYDREQIVSCIDKGILKTISNDRISKEISLLCIEQNWKDAFLLCESLNIFNLNCNLIGIPNKVIGYDDVNMRLLNLFYSFKNKDDAHILIDNSILDSNIKKSMMKLKDCSVENILKNTFGNYEIFNHLKNMSKYDLAYLSWNIELTYKIYNYIYNLEGCKLSINGNKIKALGIKDGKLIGSILRYIMKLKLNTGIEKDLDRRDMQNALEYKDREF